MSGLVICVIVAGPTRKRGWDEQLTRRTTVTVEQDQIGRMDNYESVVSEVVFGEKQAVRNYPGCCKGYLLI